LREVGRGDCCLGFLRDRPEPIGYTRKQVEARQPLSKGQAGSTEVEAMTAFPWTESGGPKIAFSPSEAEHYYQPLGAWKGPSSSREVKRECVEFWRSSGEEGVRWLVRRLREEHHVETLHAAASLLADLGEIVLGPIFEELSRGARGDQPLCLLWALDSLSESDPTLRLESAQDELVLAGLLQNEEPDVREGAAEAMRLLASERAVRWLEHGLLDESNEDVRRTLERELTWHQAGRS
jgi:hypothetical protein